jgi:ribosome maturation factor RimP
LHQLLIQFDKEGTASPLFHYQYFMDLGEKVKQLAQQFLANESQFVVNVAVSSLQGPQKVTVVLDGDAGITIDDCATVSKQLLGALEQQGLIGENFTLEVTTPGLDRPLKLKRQYVKNIGRGMRLHLNDKKVVEGKLCEVTDDTITLEQEIGSGKKTEFMRNSFRFPDIEKAFVKILLK